MKLLQTVGVCCRQSVCVCRQYESVTDSRRLLQAIKICRQQFVVVTPSQLLCQRLLLIVLCWQIKMVPKITELRKLYCFALVGGGGGGGGRRVMKGQGGEGY